MVHGRIRCSVKTVISVLMALIFVLVISPKTASAEASIDKVDINATVEADGSVDVSEARTFTGTFHGVYWRIPEGSNGSVSVVPQIEGVYLEESGQEVPLTESSSYSDGTYSIRDNGTVQTLTIYSAHDDESVTFRIVYRNPNLALRYQDASELYWKFVSDGWDTESKNVTCTINLPVPSGESVQPGKNVRAWGHGPLDGSLNFNGNSVVYTAPGVGGNEFAEARILFPAEWLSAASPDAIQQSSITQTVLSEEQTWADQANAQRRRAQIEQVVAVVVPIGLSVFAIVFSILAYRDWKKKSKVLFDDEYFRDVPSKDHPAVLNAVLNNAEADGNAFSASVLRLSDMGYIRLDHDQPAKKRLFHKPEKDWYVEFVKWPEKENDPQGLDQKTMGFLFQDMAPLIKQKGDEEANSEHPRVYFYGIKKAADNHARAYNDAYENWTSAVMEATLNAGYFVGHNKSKGVPHLGVFFGVVAAAVSLWGLFVLSNPALMGAFLILSIVASVVSGICAGLMDTYTPEGREIAVKLRALRHWLEDFTNLDEAVPHDVILWNRLLVMAVTFGISQKVIAALKVAEPELYNELISDTHSPFFWYAVGGYDKSPFAYFTNSLPSGMHAVDTSTLASSTFSSGDGFGGGFSGGGGGGFGGGGGGGSF